MPTLSKAEYLDLLKMHAKHYHSEQGPIVSDAEYDNLVKNYTKQFGEPPFVGDPSLERGIEHTERMYSLANAMNEIEIRSNLKRMSSGKNLQFCVEPKYDGMACSLIYKDGTLTQALTRGDGKVGVDITHAVLALANYDIPRELSQDVTVTVRGELYITHHNLKWVNQARETLNLPPYKNTRNGLVGMVMSKEIPDWLNQSNVVGFSPYDVTKATRPNHVKTQEDLLTWLGDIGIRNSLCIVLADIRDIIEEYKDWERKRGVLGYDIDGVVIKLNDLDARGHLGYTATTPNWAIAAKFLPAQEVATIQGVSYQVGRTGVITPVANITPTNLSGVIISRVTLYNFDIIRQLDLMVGDKCEIHRAGDVVPRIGRRLERTPGTPYLEITPPSRCPECGGETTYREIDGGVYCSNVYRCPAQLKAKIDYYFSEKGVYVKGLGKRVIARLVDDKRVSSIADIYRLTEDDLRPYLHSRADAIYQKIQETKKAPFELLLCALGIPHVATTSSAHIAKTYNSLDAIKRAGKETLATSRGVGNAVAESLIHFIDDPVTKAIIDELKSLGVKI